ncbi:hypothetical protein F441_07918 [Phytophthora nicotianae CJ01A1]|uniref:Uncharacterized protein n=5 Tax=Phytophthora nicotianae TaxID=4792 RepID=V9F8W8_PHYNI|nr:hypothetical protein F443_07946 [Phytophthora nicotianae P1569]ETK87871.1 hypothetical protein L915_07775 [Phytophthora nicotianae]ETO76660.1 hypothetical protein F444_07992 [Phytophthora nicotianae P1976]ETP17742.1 hypothetical protein F441_07918 [Phytophthora nicotianae CJ01A1]ETP45759.1 hypothetical protein F442_07886 [Phytophthora nicotianae P10297]
MVEKLSSTSTSTARSANGLHSTEAKAELKIEEFVLRSSSNAWARSPSFTSVISDLNPNAERRKVGASCTFSLRAGLNSRQAHDLRPHIKTATSIFS